MFPNWPFKQKYILMAGKFKPMYIAYMYSELEWKQCVQSCPMCLNALPFVEKENAYRIKRLRWYTAEDERREDCRLSLSLEILINKWNAKMLL